MKKMFMRSDSNPKGCSCAFTLLVVFIATITSAHSAVAQPVRLGKNFEPHPYQTPLMTLKRGPVPSGRSNFSRCGSGGTTSSPTWTFEFSSPMRGVLVRFVDSNGRPFTHAALVTPSGAIGCSGSEGAVYMADAAAGVYKVFFVVTRAVSVQVRVEQPHRTKQAVLTKLASMPNIDAPGALNPQYVRLSPGAPVDVRALGLRCDPNVKHVAPLGRISVKQKGDYYLASKRFSLVITKPDGTCIPSREGIRIKNTYRLTPGRYFLWSLAPGGESAPAAVVEVDAIDRPYALGKAKVYSLVGLRDPVLLSGTTRAAERWPSRFLSDACRGAARTPDFYLQVDKHSKLTLEMYRAANTFKLHLFGPIQTAPALQAPLCDQKHLSIDGDSGTYAVWVRGPVGKTFHVVARRSDIKPDPLTALLPIPQSMSIEERALGHHYPYYTDDDATLMLLSVPLRLFAYTTRRIKTKVHAKLYESGTDIDVSFDRTLEAGEPVLVESMSEDSVRVLSCSGEIMSVPRDSLTGDRPGKITLPKQIQFEPRKTYREAIGLLDRREDGAIEKTVTAMTKKYEHCVTDYMLKHDPTYNKSYKLVYTRGRHQGKTTTDLHFERAEKRCGRRKIKRAKRKALTKINAARKRRAIKLRRAMRKRFGL